MTFWTVVHRLFCMKIEYTEKDIAKYALCSEANVIKAEQRGKFTVGDFGSVVEFAILMRMKEIGVSGWIDGMPRGEAVDKPKAVFPNMITAEKLASMKIKKPIEHISSVADFDEYVNQEGNTL